MHNLDEIHEGQICQAFEKVLQSRVTTTMSFWCYAVANVFCSQKITQWHD